MMYEPRYTPWGHADNCICLCEGAYLVSTPGHGGIMIDQRKVNALLSKAAQEVGFYECGYLCFEEDCDASVAFRELLDRKLITTYESFHGTPEEFAELIDKSCQRHNAQYWQARNEALAK